MRSGGRAAISSPLAAPATASARRVGLPVTASSATIANSSAAPCCHSAWLEMDQVSVPKAKARVSSRARLRCSCRRSSRYMSAQEAAATVAAAAFSVSSAAISTSRTLAQP